MRKADTTVNRLNNEKIRAERERDELRAKLSVVMEALEACMPSVSACEDIWGDFSHEEIKTQPPSIRRAWSAGLSPGLRTALAKIKGDP